MHRPAEYMRGIAFRAYGSVIGTVTVIKHHPVDRNAVDIDIHIDAPPSVRPDSNRLRLLGRQKC